MKLAAERFGPIRRSEHGAASECPVPSWASNGVGDKSFGTGNIALTRPAKARRMGRIAMAFSVATSTASPALADADKAQQAASPEPPSQSSPAGTNAALGQALRKLDDLLSQLDASIEHTWARAEDMLRRADAATDPDEQLRLEELYGKIAAVAEDFEERRLELRALRRELAATSEETTP